MDETLFANLIENSLHMNVCINCDGRILYANAAWVRAFGNPGEGANKRVVLDQIHPDYRFEFNKLFRSVLAGESISRMEMALIASDGCVVSVEGSLKSVADQVVHGVFLDITERKRAEDVLARQATALLRVHNTLEARDRELANTLEQARKLREAQERAQVLAKINEELKQEIALRQEAEAKIRASLEEKEVLLKEIHHRVKNNLQIISSLLNLQSGYVDDVRTLEMFKESQSRIQSMALIHEKLYRSGDLAQVDFADYIENLVHFLTRSYSPGGITVSLDIKKVFFSLDTSIPCGLIVSELVSNAFKYAFPDGRTGEVYVRLEPVDTVRYRLTVGDNGVGFPKDIDFRQTDSLGLQLVTTLTDQIDGEIELDRSSGTAFHIVFTVHKSDRPVA